MTNPQKISYSWYLNDIGVYEHFAKSKYVSALSYFLKARDIIKDIKSYSSLKMEDMNNIIFSHLSEWCNTSNYGDDTAIMSCKFF